MIISYITGSLGLKGLVKEMHCCPSWTKPDTSETSLVQVLPVVVSTVSGHAPDPARHYHRDYDILSKSRVSLSNIITTCT